MGFITNKFNDSVNKKKQIVIASIISFVLLMLDLVFAIFFPRWINSVIGQENYGVYTLSLSLVAMFLMDFGLCRASDKFLSKVVAEKKFDKEADYFSIIYKIYLIIDFFVAIAFLIVFLLMDKIYVGLTAEQLRLLKIIFPILAVYNLINFPFLSLSGSFVSHEQFIAQKSFSLAQKVLYTALISVFLALKLNVVYISIAAVISGIVILISKILFCYFKCNMRIKLRFWDKKIAKQVFGFSVWVTLALIASKLIASLIPSILGVVSDATNIAVYGYAYALECNAYILTTIISSMSIPNITRLMKDRKESNEEVDKLAIKIGKIQVFIISLFFFGFVVFGKEFLNIVMGSKYLNSYYCFILLFIPNLLFASLDVCENVAQVSNRIEFLSVARITSAVFVMGFSFLFGKFYGAIGVCACYCFFQTLCCVVIIIFVYSKKLKMNMKRIIFKIFAPSIIPVGVTVGVFMILKNTVISFSKILPFLIGIAIFSIIYLGLYYLFSISPSEKVLVYKKIFRKKDTKQEIDSSLDYVVINSKKIPLDENNISKIIIEDKIDNIEVNTVKYGNSLAFNNINNQNYYFCFEKSKYKENSSNVLVCNNTVFKSLKSKNQYDKIIIIIEDKK